MLNRLRERLGDVWGKATTVILGLIVAILPALQAIDPTLLPTWAKLAIALLGVVAVAMRFLAPPPASIQVRPEDTVIVNDSNSVTVQTAAPLPAKVVDKAAGEKT
jgi:hypothetical protein